MGAFPGSTRGMSFRYSPDGKHPVVANEDDPPKVLVPSGSGARAIAKSTPKENEKPFHMSLLPGTA
jgi:hypothetical protein